ncbi:MAG: family 78 glycoside hydrolase catalytic domain [Bacteroidota bacterium]
MILLSKNVKGAFVFFKEMKISLFVALSSFLMLQGCFMQDSLPPATELALNEGFKNPLGFYDAIPSFSWKLPIGTIEQRGFHIVVASSPDLLPDKADLWDTDKVSSNQSLYVPYAGKPLSSRKKIYWQVRYWNEKDNPSQWSEIAKMELGLLQNKDWKAQWMGLDTRKDSIKGKNDIILHTPQQLRKRFEVKTTIVEARLYVSAKGVFKGYLNGEEISSDVMAPGWTPYQKRIESLTYDVTDLVREGENTLAFQLASGWHFGRMLWNKMIWGKKGSPQVLGQLELLYSDGTKQTIVSDESWKGSTKGPIRFAEIYDGETYDANYEMPGWTTSNFKDDTWDQVIAEEMSDSIQIRPKRHNTVKAKIKLPTQNIIHPQEGSAVIFDLEQNLVGVPKLKVPMKKGDTLKVRFSEMLAPDGSFYTDNYRSAKSTDHYIAAKDGVIDWHPTFTFHGFQYVELSGFDTSQTPEKDWVTGMVQYSDFDENGTFQSSHTKLNQLQSNIVWGLRGNFFDIPTDCPQRDERLGWTGDAQVFAPTSIFNADVHSFWNSWLQTLRESQFENGGIPFIAPDVLENGAVSSGWGDAAVIIPWEIYMRTGDISVLSENFQMMEGWVAHHKSATENYISKMNSYGDWLQPYQSEQSKNRGDTSKALIGTAFFAHAAHLTSKAAGILGLDAEKEMYQKLYKTVAQAFENEFFEKDGSVKNSKGTQTAYLLALNFELLSENKKELAKLQLLDKIKEADNHLRTGFLGTPLLPKVLDDMGNIDLMYDILLKETYPSWFYSINQGATTIWERWNSYSKLEGYNPQSMNSLNHYAYGAIGEWMYERIAGIKALEPGYKKIRIAPVPGGGLTSASASYDSPYGNIESSWKIDNSTFYLEVLVPPNTSALISIPSADAPSVLVNGKKVQEWKTIEVQESTEGFINLKVRPGPYQIESNFDL